jgi:hypothetical protein
MCVYIYVYIYPYVYVYIHHASYILRAEYLLDAGGNESTCATGILLAWQFSWEQKVKNGNSQFIIF